jgi:hypothetical protein
MVRALVFAPLMLAACPEPSSNVDALTNEVATFRIQMRQLEIVSRQYDEAIADATQATCIGVHRNYDLQARMILMNAYTVTTELDTAITVHGGAGFADVACTVSAIETERSYHGALACQELALADNQAEAARHLIALGALTTHLDARVSEIEAGQALPPETETWTWTLAARCP